MKRTEYKFRGKVVCYVDESLRNAECAFFKTPDGQFTRCTAQDAHALASAYLEQLKHVTPCPSEN
jgi:hypothetical protein